MRAALAAIGLLTILTLGCGDGSFIIVFNSGIIASDPICGNGTGRFDLQNQSGLLLIVVINSDTKIVAANGSPARCADLRTGVSVQVLGPQQGRTVTAETVHLQG